MPDGRGLILIVGPSGVGKDSVIATARERLAGDPRVQFVRRAITRPAAGDAERHDPHDDAAFEMRAQRGEFALHWRANGYRYGLPRSLEAAIAGGVAVANVSRGVLEEARRRYPGLLVCRIAASPATLRRRLEARGREDAKQIEARLARAAAFDVTGPDVVTIENDEPLPLAGLRLANLIGRRLPRLAA